MKITVDRQGVTPSVRQVPTDTTMEPAKAMLGRTSVTSAASK